MAALPDGAVRAQRVDEAARALDAAIRRLLALRRERVGQLAARLRSPADRVDAARRRHRELWARLDAAIDRRVQRDRAAVDALSGRLEALSPLAVLDRGFAIVRGPAGVVRAPGDVSDGDPLEIRVRGGRIHAEVRTPGTPAAGRPPRSG